MTPQVENALRSVARECRKAVLAAIDGKSRAEQDAITTELLDKYTKKITCLPPGGISAKLWLIYYVRLIDKEQRGKA